MIALAVKVSHYEDLEQMRRLVSEGAHRDLVGGLWDEIGRLTFDYLVARGLSPAEPLLDIGCGCLRVGVHLVEYLDRGRYYGVDISEDLLNAGFDTELARLGLQHKLPRQNLLCDREFRFERLPGAPRFGVALAQSVFTHLTLNHIRLCLARLARVTAPGARCFATVFPCREDQDWAEEIEHQPGGIVTHPEREPYHYRHSDLLSCLHDLPWEASSPQDWGHPRAQAMVTFVRT